MLRADPYDRETLIYPLFRASQRFWVVVIVLVAIIIGGIILYIQQIQEGLVTTGMDRPVYWGLYMVNFVFFIGVSLAGTLTSAVLRITGVEWRRPITRMAETITVFALLIATLQIVIDMGRPDRLLYVMLYGRLQSPILWDVFIVTTYLLSSVTYLFLPMIPDIALIRDNMPPNAPRWQATLYRTLALGWRGNIEQWRRLEKIVSFMALFIIPVGVAVHTITSWLLATTVQPGWHSTVFGPYFVVTAVFSGISALFIVMTISRRILNLDRYITHKQYKGLTWLFMTMAITWGYFTYTETLTLVAGQQMMEFAVLASKLWGDHVVSFWLMLFLIGLGFVIMLLTQITPSKLRRVAIFQPRFSLSAGILAVGVIVFLLDAQDRELVISSGNLDLGSMLWTLAGLLLFIWGVGVAIWLKKNLVIAAPIAGAMVIAGTWMERWNIIVPTLTHPRMIAYDTYTPTFTEIGISIASLALFILLFVVFYKLFPAVSIWEIAEGRVIDEAYDSVEIPVPEPSASLRKKQRWTFK